MVLLQRDADPCICLGPQVLKIDIEGSEWGLFADFYRNPGATLPATNLMVEFHMPNDVAEVFQVIDMILADGFRCVLKAQKTGGSRTSYVNAGNPWTHYIFGRHRSSPLRDDGHRLHNTLKMFGCCCRGRAAPQASG